MILDNPKPVLRETRTTHRRTIKMKDILNKTTLSSESEDD